MAYCTHADVQKRLQQIELSGTSDPSEGEVAEWCSEVSEDMDSKMGAAGITTPVVDTGKIKVLRRIAVTGVLAEVYRSILAEGEQSDRYQDLYDKAMSGIMKSPDIMLTTTNEESPSHGFDAPSTRYTRGADLW